MTACNLTPPCAECSLRQLAASTPLLEPPNALLGQASAVFEAVRCDPLALAPDTDLLTMHLRAMCAVVRGLAGWAEIARLHLVLG